MLCLRKTWHIASRIAAVEGLNLPAPLINSVRGIKPRWLPKSRSKILYVRTPTPINPEEHEKLRTAYFHYRSHRRAIRKFLVDQQTAKVNLMREQLAADDRDHAAEMKLMEELNNQWNSRVTSVREEAWLQEKEKQEARNRKWLERDQHKQAKRQQKAEEKLEQNLKGEESFITADNLDVEIEKLLNLRQDYNFAIDKQGNVISESEVDTTKTAGSSQQQTSAQGS
ncbi:hypothetical protein ACOMHN_048595 [Nucella lapillus]